MISLARLTLADRSGLARERFRLEAALTAAGHVALTLEQGIEPDRPWGTTVTLMPTFSVADLRRLRDLLSSVIFSAEACLDAANARGGTRTPMASRPRDFESRTSTGSVTLASAAGPEKNRRRRKA